MKKLLALFSLFIWFALPSNELFAAKKKKRIIGRVEWIAFPSFKLNILSRIDTGAKTCSIHASNIKVFTIGEETFIEFETLDHEGKTVRIKSRLVDQKKIRSSTGKLTKRYIIREKIQFKNIKKTVLINLNSRDEMRYNFLVGRNFLRGRFLVDVAKSHTWEPKNEN